MSTTYQVEFGHTTIEYEVDFSERGTLAIHVHPDLRVTVTAPENCDLAIVEEKVRKRAPWIVRQRQDFERYLPHLPPREYVSGETHRYLGRQYRLKVAQSQTSYEVVKMQRGRIVVSVVDTDNTEKIQQFLDDWYRKRAKIVFQDRLNEWFPKARRLGIEHYPEISLRVMKTRWGSCTAAGDVLLNPKLVQVPKYCIDYVIVHELCHLREHNHSNEFYRLLDTIMPDWAERKRQLDEYEFN